MFSTGVWVTGACVDMCLCTWHVLPLCVDVLCECLYVRYVGQLMVCVCARMCVCMCLGCVHHYTWASSYSLRYLQLKAVGPWRASPLASFFPSFKDPILSPCQAFPVERSRKNFPQTCLLSHPALPAGRSPLR